MENQVCLTLNNGVKIPQMGLGVFESKDETVSAVKNALYAGYRHIDTASYYQNEALVLQGIKESGVKREDVFITTKIWNDDMRASKQHEAIEESLKNLGGEYIDLFLIHWPVKDYFVKTWKIMEKYYRKGAFRAIGVSNFHKTHFDELLKYVEIIPAINQIELHPYLSQKQLAKFCFSKGIVVECWAPLARAKTASDETLIQIGKKYDKTPAQITLRWQIQRGLVTIPKSVHKERIVSNFKIFDFELSPDDMEIINSLNKNERMFENGNPDTFTF